MIRWIRRTLGLKGSFSWAVKQMRKGRLVMISGSIYRFSATRSNTLECQNIGRWMVGIIMLSDILSLDWEIYSGNDL